MPLIFSKPLPIDIASNSLGKTNSPFPLVFIVAIEANYIKSLYPTWWRRFDSRHVHQHILYLNLERTKRKKTA